MSGLSSFIKKIPFKHMFFMALIVGVLMSDTFTQFIGSDWKIMIKLVLFAIFYVFFYAVVELKIV